MVPNLHDKQRQRAAPSVYGVGGLTDAGRAHAPVETLRVRVAFDPHGFDAQGRGPANGVVEQEAPDACAYALRRYPQVLDLSTFSDEGVETEDLPIERRRVDLGCGG